MVTDPEKNTMIRADEVTVNFTFASLFDRNQINIDGAAIEGAQVNLAKIQGNDSTKDLNINVLISRLRPSSGGGASSTKVNIGEIVLAHSSFSYNDSDKDSLKKQFDYHHFALDIPEGALNTFKVIGDTIQFSVDALTTTDRATQFRIENLNTFFRISQKSMEFLNVDLQTPDSHIKDTIKFTYASQRDLSDFVRRVNISANLSHTVISPKELALFAPGIERMQNPISLDGKFSGRVNRFFGENTRLHIGNTTIAGRIEMDGLPRINETFINLRLGQSRIDIHDLSFLFNEKLFARLKPLAQFSLSGNFTGFVNDFVANATFDGPIGKIKSDINLKINERAVDQSIYKGNVQLTNFDLGRYLNDTILFQKVDMNGRINGRGFSESTADFLLNGTISSIGIRGYNYQNITTNARLRSQFFNGDLSIHDPNLQFEASGSIDFSEEHELVKVKARLDTAHLDRVGLTKEKLFITTYADINSTGLTLDQLFGDAAFWNTKVTYRDKSLAFDSIHVVSSISDSIRQLMLQSTLADVKMTGNYYYSSLFRDLNQLFTELYLTIKNDRSELDKYYETKAKEDGDYSMSFQVDLDDVNPLIQLAGLNLSVSKGSRITGKFASGYTSIFTAFSHLDTINFNGKLFLDNEVEINGSKIRDSTNVLAMLYFSSGQQRLAKNVNTVDLLVEGIWDKDHVDVGLDIDQEGLANSMRLKAEVDFLYDSTRIKILPSRIKVLNDDWMVDRDNYALWFNNEWFIHDLRFTNRLQSIQANGIVSASQEKALKLQAENLNLQLLNNFSTEKFSGFLNGSAEATGLLGEPFIQNTLTIADLTVNNFLIGTVSGKNEWNPDKRQFDIDFVINRLNVKTVDLSGFYNPVEKEPLQVKAELTNANLEMIEPLLRGLFSGIKGTATGTFDITGSFGNPKIAGESQIRQGKLTIDYLNTTYNFSGLLGMTPDQIRFRNFEVTDVLNNKGTLEGTISHRGFSDFRLDLGGTYNNLQVLNTTAKDNSLFYGQGYATGDVSIVGPSDNLKIAATARSEKNTRIYIPIDLTEDVVRKDFINFVSFTDTTTTPDTPQAGPKKKTTAGLTMDLNLDVTQDAYAEIIFDIKTGEIIRGRGNGEIKLQIDTKGDFNMFGVLEFTQGAYNFTLYDIINKEFDIKPGSRISWYGDPYEGILDITATYRQLASLVPILSDQSLLAQDEGTTTLDPQLKRKYPAEVELMLEGPMLKPRINFDIFARDLPQNIDVNGRNVSLNFEFQAFKARLDEQELKRQVFSLIVLRRFSPPDAFNTSGTITNSMSEFLSNQLSYWLTQVDQNLEIDLDLGSMDAEAFNTFQLRLSYSFLNGRLRVTRDGTISNQFRASDNISSIAGDWTVDYLLTPDGTLKIKMYSRSNYNQINSQLGTQSAVTTGVSLLHTQNFNEFNELLKSSHEKKRKETLDEESPSPDDGSY